MQFKIPKNDRRTVWTKHAIKKMKYYGLSVNRIKRVLWHPSRTEEGIAPQTIAIMQKYGSLKHPKEIWVMYQSIHQKDLIKKKIISAWRYPGISPQGKEIYIPNDTQEILEKIKKTKNH